MPQLDPAPWMFIFAFSWLVFITILPPKVIAHAYPNDPSPQTTQKVQTNSWSWPWL